MKLRRPNSIEEVAKLVELGRAMHAESTFKNMDFDRKIAGETILRLMESPTGYMMMACDENDEPIGGIAALVTQAFFGKDKVASEMAFYVSPDRRGRLAGARLAQAYVAWAKVMGAKRINAGNSAGMNDELYVRFWTGLGFKRAGSLMYMEA
jgi:GNAT superfamily N-acetyltransferase